MVRLEITGSGGDEKLRQHVAEVLRLAAEYMKVDNGYVEVNLVTDAEMQKNVLSYEAPKYFSRPDLTEKPLGEIYLNPGYIKAHNENFDLMLVHGFLHLLGFDHKTDADQAKMEAKEGELLRLLSRV